MSTMVALFYMLSSIHLQVNDGLFYGASTMKKVLDFGVVISGILCSIIVFYTNGFVFKRRTRELGLYNILGMEKKHICLVAFWETLMVGVGSILVGLISG